MAEIINFKFHLAREISGGGSGPPPDDRWIKVLLIIVILCFIALIYFNPIGEHGEAERKFSEDAVQAPK